MELFPILVALMGSTPPSFSYRQASWNFEADEPGQIAEEVMSGIGKWEVINDGD